MTPLRLVHSERVGGGPSLVNHGQLSAAQPIEGSVGVGHGGGAGDEDAGMLGARLWKEVRLVRELRGDVPYLRGIHAEIRSRGEGRGEIGGVREGWEGRQGREGRDQEVRADAGSDAANNGDRVPGQPFAAQAELFVLAPSGGGWPGDKTAADVDAGTVLRFGRPAIATSALQQRMTSGDGGLAARVSIAEPRHPGTQNPKP